MRYPGGKGKCYQRLINLMPPHQTYIETHLGAGAVMRHKKTAARNIGVDIDPAVHQTWATLDVQGLELVQGDASRFLGGFEFEGSELIYADPPYVTETRRRSKIYRFEYDLGQHEELLRTLSSAPCKVMISGYDNALYNETLQGWRKVTFMAKTHTDLREECVWMNYAAPQELHDSRYLGDTFRERQTIARRHSRLRDRVNAMDPVERNDFLRWITQTYGSVQEAR
ncbi:DNA methylase [Pseudomonas sp. GP01-A8]|nr:DNA methylase [Pseudomonas sp. GP01-A9]PMU23208.1 DNA methylase [Pseudomonas sp. GP01-A13]PMU37083.1 DNA methylase [Pseudomonas sp. GP01-A8]PMU48407.1 DNA methylase [Pseudomonas sp. GP01-A14]PMU51127.1 DNA methylase [Pseudomonas sp. GP01-A6]PMU61206.1 DNA methylase [Pseudomonas sp. GP01-A3]PMU67689.1 DNA methylase [Pseudomonas sp. FW215-L2]PMU67972.1 DNA methylase [Pseudomonas sp. GP01-A1]PMU72815.1 DNA methylase [Pseudomonas sp. GP01-A5]PMV02740.1 DNA methylase [Pseudomonas sp. GP01-A1